LRDLDCGIGDGLLHVADSFMDRLKAGSFEA